MIEEYENILERYDLKVNSCYKGRGAIIIESDNGLKVLKPTKLHEEKIKFLYELEEQLYSKGFLVDRLIRTEDNNYYVKEDEDLYILKEWVEGREIYFNDQDEILLAIESMAKLHKSTKNMLGQKKYRIYDKTGNLIHTLKRHNVELVRIRNKIRKMGKWSEFDILYLKCFQDYYMDAQKTLKQMSPIYNNVIASYNNKVIIHGLCNHHNLIIDRYGKLHMFNFEYAAYDLPVVDIYRMLRKILEKNDWDISIGIYAIKKYLEVNPLNKEELKIMLYLFMYPEKYWKISNYYFNLNKAWKPKQTLIKLKRLLAQEEKKKEFIAYLEDFIEIYC
jgi:CotS family spore coat protein